MKRAEVALVGLVLAVALGLASVTARERAGTAGAAAGNSLPYYIDSALTPVWLDSVAAESAHTIGRFRLVDQEASIVEESDLDGKIYVASFIFTRCGGLCPVMVSNLRPVQDAFLDNDGVVLVSYTADPDHDTSQVLARFARTNGIRADKWHLLTGDRDQIYGLARRSYFAEGNRSDEIAPEDFLHTEKVILIDGNRRIRGVYNGMLPLDMTRLVEDIETLGGEA